MKKRLSVLTPEEIERLELSTPKEVMERARKLYMEALEIDKEVEAIEKLEPNKKKQRKLVRLFLHPRGTTKH